MAVKVTRGRSWPHHFLCELGKVTARLRASGSSCIKQSKRRRVVREFHSFVHSLIRSFVKTLPGTYKTSLDFYHYYYYTKNFTH